MNWYVDNKGGRELRQREAFAWTVGPHRITMESCTSLGSRRNGLMFDGVSDKAYGAVPRWASVARG